MAYKATDYPITVLEPADGRVTQFVNADFYYNKTFVPNPVGTFKEIHEKVPWEQGRVQVYGKWYDEPRLTRLYSTHPGTYSYAGRTAETIAFPEFLDKLRLNVSAYCSQLLGQQYVFDTCLCNYYRNGKDKIGMHSDGEKDLLPGAPIASISLGAIRNFDVWCKEAAPVKHDRYRIPLASGSLLVMARNSQSLYLHGIAEQKKVKEPRINLTFRVTKAV